MQRLYVAAAQEIAEVCEEAPRCTPAEAAKGWLMAARFAMWRVWAADAAASKGIARRAGICAYVDGLRSRLLQQAAGWKGDVCYQEVAVRGGPGVSVGHMPVRQAEAELAVGRMPSMQAQADHAWRYWWRQGGFELLEGAARRLERELRARKLELAKGQLMMFLASGVCSGVAAATVVRRLHDPVVELCEGGTQVVIERRAAVCGGGRRWRRGGSSGSERAGMSRMTGVCGQCRECWMRARRSAGRDGWFSISCSGRVAIRTLMRSAGGALGWGLTP